MVVFGIYKEDEVEKMHNKVKIKMVTQKFVNKIRLMVGAITSSKNKKRVLTKRMDWED